MIINRPLWRSEQARGATARRKAEERERAARDADAYEPRYGIKDDDAFEIGGGE